MGETLPHQNKGRILKDYHCSAENTICEFASLTLTQSYPPRVWYVIFTCSVSSDVVSGLSNMDQVREKKAHWMLWMGLLSHQFRCHDY